MRRKEESKSMDQKDVETLNLNDPDIAWAI